MLAGIGNQLAEFREFFGGGPVAAVAAVLLLGCIVLFGLLIRSKDAQIKLAAGAQAGKLTELVEVTTDAVTQVLQSIEELRKARKAFERELARVAKRTSTDKTLPVVPGIDPSKKERP
jgi:membrane protein involved in colicin uptake